MPTDDHEHRSDADHGGITADAALRGAGRHPSAIARFLLACIVLLAADLIVKATAFSSIAGAPITLERDEHGQLAPIPPHDSTILVPNVLAVHLTVNYGAVFGLGKGGRWIFVVFSVIAIGVIGSVFLRSRTDAWVLHVTLGAVLAGALGNLYDRLCYGVVRDMFLLFPGVKLPFGWHWPDGSAGLYPWIFNVADVCLVVGLCILMIILYRHDRRVNRERRSQPAG